ncbi:hypothetical protein CC86DRAFT_321588 [Ophiobolus disseminans]|uniref:Uncharacterized protein n=1 Tax=Ophiobolus disseminans TaxID=1469910 RepID=A0A6A7A4H1_9PLEO|nr:hypothetical protein CC86DRAFT_321588 [Ophiobolus disseminans]
MAPNGHALSEAQAADSLPRGGPPPPWLKEHGEMEFKEWKKKHDGQSLTKEDWESSQRIDGLCLFYAAATIWDEDDSSSEELEVAKVEPRLRGVRAQSAREPKKTLKTNGTGPARSTGSATPSSMAQVEDLSPSAKKKRKARKKYLSQEMVASEESEDVEAATLISGAMTPSAPIITVNGRRKSSNRKPRKKPLSEETISPADEEEDPMAMNGITTPAIVSPLPVRSAPRSSTSAQTSEPHKKTFLKLSTRKVPKKKVLSEETVLDDDTDEGRAAGAALSTVTTVTEPNITATTECHTPLATNTTANSNEATASPDPTSESASATRRGLRARRPAQQRPYSYDAQIFEEPDDDVPEEEEIIVQPVSNVQSRRVSVASLGKSYTEDKVEHLDEEGLAILQGDVDPEPEDSYGRPKHYKGKGRAWKKEESDEDLEFNPSKKKAARAKAKARALTQQQQQQPKKRGRPRKTILSEDVVRDDSDDDATARTEDASPSPPVWEAPAKKARKPARKSALSEAIVRDDTDDETQKDKPDQTAATSLLPEVSTPAPKKRGRPRKSDQSATPAGRSEKRDDDLSYTPKGTPSKSFTPKAELKSSTPTHEPQQVSSVADDMESVDMDLGGSSQDESDLDLSSAEPSPKADIEAHMASVNADDDDEEL